MQYQPQQEEGFLYVMNCDDSTIRKLVQSEAGSDSYQTVTSIFQYSFLYFVRERRKEKKRRVSQQVVDGCHRLQEF